MINGKAAQFKPFWAGNEKHLAGVGIFLAKKWVDKLIHISRVNDRLIVIRVLAQEIIISVISVLTPHCGLEIAWKIISMVALSMLLDS